LEADIQRPEDYCGGINIPAIFISSVEQGIKISYERFYLKQLFPEEIAGKGSYLIWVGNL
jgi:hypothetical protein